jgi:hypothetical protein
MTVEGVTPIYPGMPGTARPDTMSKALNKSCQNYEQADKNIIISFHIFMIYL